MDKKDSNDYKNLLTEAGIFFPGATKGSFILPPNGYLLWRSIQQTLNERFLLRGAENVLLPTLIPLELLSQEEKHIEGFKAEVFMVERAGDKTLEQPLVLRPTSEVLFYDWFRRKLTSYRDLPFLYNQWCSVFRAEKSSNTFFRSTEFYWQEGHTLHYTAEEARSFALDVWKDYQDYLEQTLCLAVMVGKKSEGEKFAGALETYTVEGLLPDGQCLQLATSHYFGNNFCRLMKVEFQDKDNSFSHPFSTSWGLSTRVIGALTKTHQDKLGLIIPVDVAPTQVAFIVFAEKGDSENQVQEYYFSLRSLLAPYLRCRLYNKKSTNSLNLAQADREGCPFKIIIGQKEVESKKITLTRRNEGKTAISVDYDPSEEETKNGLLKVLGQEMIDFKKRIYRNSELFLKEHTWEEKDLKKIKERVKGEEKGVFLVPFCNLLECEKQIKEKLPSYSIRCLVEKQAEKEEECVFCGEKTLLQAYLGRSY